MRAVIIRQYGGPEQLSINEIASPVPGERELLIKVKACGLNPIDFKTRNGNVKLLLPYPMPLILGNELSGEVVQIGAQVTRFHVGERIAARVEKLRAGAFAEFACVNEDVAAHLPISIDDAKAAALPLAGLTAWQCLHDVLLIRPGQRVLIHAGAGGVGHLAIQLAKSMGATVATTASASKFEFLRSLGADELIDYHQQCFEDHIDPVDAVLDTQGGDILLRSIVHTKPGGAVVTIGGLPTPEVAVEFSKPLWLKWLFAWITRRERALAAQRQVRFRYWFMRPDGAQLQRLVDLIEHGELKINLQTYSGLDRIPEAMANLESGHTSGKLVVVV